MCNKEKNKFKYSYVAYGNKGEEKTSGTSQKKEKPQGGSVPMHECSINFLYSTNERACTSKAMHVSTTEVLMA